jgi:hypothetical protein
MLTLTGFYKNDAATDIDHKYFNSIQNNFISLWYHIYNNNNITLEVYNTVLVIFLVPYEYIFR